MAKSQVTVYQSLLVTALRFLKDYRRCGPYSEHHPNCPVCKQSYDCTPTCELNITINAIEEKTRGRK